MSATLCAPVSAPLPPLDLPSLRTLATASLMLAQSVGLAAFLWLVVAGPGFIAPDRAPTPSRVHAAR